ncbi:putative diguanylate cyclase/phosphodiesterase with GAF sensor [Actinoplanes missouriensis 431]|uniref:Putative diguanylate cyclase/phosphodiesterase with GAF sensor n=1 Tax=Actinoplanes missouriensis (strain ATCC 14538 / DSM 43046 / CBS 188.64 / JCM 3121 / NBRC 102363 / NCIMB 12654 / NRRL B-3342 / UNCC 431) TaxID=512565 RepID=I0H5P8_ACTM4|nr:EAL domain-containing protein [Actinoplanes missouriensis]BAL88335.1 putative diguanylate cyclase/phosphodiesterase with GAF sensor [Actinoplanes missouriensis 431]
MALHWSTHQLTEFFSAVSASGDADAAVRIAVPRALEALDADAGAVVLDGETGVRGLTGLPGEIRAEQLSAAVAGEPIIDLPLLGEVNSAYAALGSGIGGGLVVARLDDEFSAEERQMLQGMAQVLGLALRNLRTLATERALREEGARRQALLETLLAVQRSISRREPLQSVLDAITVGASGLLGQVPVALALCDPAEPGRLIVASRAHWPEPATTASVVLGPAADAIEAGQTVRRTSPSGDRITATPVHARGDVAGSLVAAGLGDTDTSHVMTALSQQISIALTDARTVEAMREAYRDPLTGLPNRRLFAERLDQSLTGEQCRAVVLLFIDLDRFKAVNDTLGHNAGDELLAAVSERIRGQLRPSDVAGRLGGDEFAVLMEDVTIEDARAVAERIVARTAEPFSIAGRVVHIGASIGIAAAAVGGVDATGILGNADIAMYRAKRTGSGRVVVYTADMHAGETTRLRLRADLEDAVPGRQLQLTVQPLARLSSGTLDGVEVAVRWRHSSGAVAYAELAALATEAGLIGEIGGWMLRETIACLHDWRAVRPGLTAGVSICAQQIADERFASDVAAALENGSLPGSALVLQATEAALTADPVRAASTLRLLRHCGVRLAVADFGTGPSSLSLLRQFPVDQVRIDRSFVSGMTRSSADLAVVRAIVGAARALDLEIVADGVQDAEQAQALVRMGCHLGQGNHLYGPMEPRLFTTLLRRGQALPRLTDPLTA